MSEPLNRDLYSKIYGDEYVARLDAEHRRQAGVPPRPQQPPMNQIPPTRGYGQQPNPYAQPQVGPYGTPIRQPYQASPYGNPYGGYPMVPPRREHNFGIHILLFFLTGGIGNIIYYFWVTSENRRLGYY